MKAKALVYMKDGRIAETTTTRDALADFFKRHDGEILAALIDMNMTRWFWSTDTGWERATKFSYVPNRPELWRNANPTTRPTSATPW